MDNDGDRPGTATGAASDRARGALSAAFRGFLAAAQQAEEHLLKRTEASPEDLAEGYLYLVGMIDLYLERTFKSFDLDRPLFVRAMDGFRTYAMPTPDNHYYTAQIDGEGVYRISGRRGPCVDFCFEVLTNLTGDRGIVGTRVSVLEFSDLTLDANGCFEIIVGGPPRETNWLATTPEARVVYVRQSSADWRTEQPTPMLIERIDRVPGHLPQPTPADVSRLFECASEGFSGIIRWNDDFARNWSEVLPENTFEAPRLGPADKGYFPGQFNTKCRFSLAPDEALVITVHPADAIHQSVALAHPVWFNSIHPRSVQSSMNLAQAHVSSDGLLRFVVSAEDPGVTNWVETCQQLRGFIFVRWQRVHPGIVPRISAKRMKMSQVRDEFPDDEPRPTAEQRIENLRLRRLAIDRRYA